MSAVRRYTQQHPLKSPVGVPEAPYDGIAELWLDDMESLGRMHDIYASVIVPDEEQFLDRAKTVMLITEEKQIIKMVDSEP